MTVMVAVTFSPKTAGLWLGYIMFVYESSGVPGPCLGEQSSIEQLCSERFVSKIHRISHLRST